MPRRSTMLRTSVSFFVPTLLVAGAIVWFVMSLGPVNRADHRTVSLVVEKKSGVRKIATSLEQHGLIRNRYAFEAAVVLAGIGKGLQAGTYDLSPDQSATAIARVLAKGVSGSGKCPTAGEVSLTIPEESTSEDIGAYLEKQGIGTKAEFVAAASIHDSRDLLPGQQFDFLTGRPVTATLEGFLYPDTYCVFSTSKSTDVVKKMLETFGAKVTPALRQQAQTQGHTLFEVVTLASIIEKEAKTSQDRALIADIFWRRIKSGLALQSDVTVRYAAEKVGKTFDTKIDSPYNTYLVQGLPLGPIDNPGLSSIQAALNPTPNDNVYFLTDASGAVHYAKTFEEHLANKRLYMP